MQKVLAAIQMVGLFCICVTHRELEPGLGSLVVGVGDPWGHSDKANNVKCPGFLKKVWRPQTVIRLHRGSKRRRWCRKDSDASACWFLQWLQGRQAPFPKTHESSSQQAAMLTHPLSVLCATSRGGSVSSLASEPSVRWWYLSFFLFLWNRLPRNSGIAEVGRNE